MVACNVCGKEFRLVDIKEHMEVDHDKHDHDKHEMELANNKVIENKRSVENMNRDYELDDIKAMEKTLDYCDREMGININANRGAKNKSQIYMEGDTGTYEFVRKNIGKVLKEGGLSLIHI